ncbi:AMP-binding protein [bacterium]|nr:AMP-binding protein [bacterium]
MSNEKVSIVPQILEKTASRIPDRIAMMVFDGSGGSTELTYSELLQKVRKLASFLKHAGFKKGQHIAVLGKNSPEWAITYFAIQTVGCVTIPLDPALRPQELRYIIRHSDAAAIFNNERFTAPLREENGFESIKQYNLEDIWKIMESEIEILPSFSNQDADLPASIIYTSGTTGSPKGVVLSHRNIIGDIDGMKKRVDLFSEDTFISVLPIHHSFEGTCGFLTPISIGSGICYARALRAKEILEDIQASNATIILGVPLLFDKIYKGIIKGVNKKGGIAKLAFGSVMGVTKLLDGTISRRAGIKTMKVFRKKAGFGNLRLMISGGAAIRPEIVDFFNYFGVTCLQGYGLSETSPVLAASPTTSKKSASVGPAISGVQLKIDLPNQDGVGEILARGVPVFQGYYKNPEATRDAFTPDGWFKTGDLGKIDDEGFLFISGRAKDVIVTAAGKNVYPDEIEEKINASKLVTESIIIGVKHANSEEPFAIIVPDLDGLDKYFSKKWTDDDVEKVMKELIEKVNNQIAPYKRIKGFKIQQEEFPKTSTKKIKRYLYYGKGIRID